MGARERRHAGAGTFLGRATTIETPVDRRGPGRGENGLGEFWRRVQWPAIGLLWLIAGILGFSGFLRHGAQSGAAASYLDVLYLDLQLFVLQSGAVAGPIPWQLEVARLLAPAVAAYTAISAIAVVFGEQFRLMRLRLLEDHVVVCGLGRKGGQLAREFCAQGEKVVVIEKESRQRDLCEADGVTAWFLPGDATDAALLRRARVEHAKCLVAVTGDDGTNVEIAVRAFRLVNACGRPRHAPLQCYVHIVNARLCRLFRQHGVFTTAGDPFEVSVFNTYENSARLLVQNYPLDQGRLTLASRASGAAWVPHLVIVGFGQMGESVALQAAKMGHFCGGARLQITIVDRAAAAGRKAFLERYPRFADICDVRFVAGETDDPEIVDRIAEPARDPNALVTVAVCLDNPSRGLACALSILAKLRHRNDVPVLVRMADATGMGSLLDATEGKAAAHLNVHAFGMTNQVCTVEMVKQNRLDTLAKARHDDFVRKRAAEGRPGTDASMQPWQRTEEDLRDSNRQQTDHIPVKLRAIGCRSSPPRSGDTPVTAFSSEEVEALARMEHARWNAERFLAGWTQGPRDPERKVSPWLVDWKDLPDNIRQYDREAVQDIPRILGLIGEKVYRQPAEGNCGSPG